MSRILLIDDDKDMLALTGRWLVKAGYEVTEAASGEEALAKLSEVKPDLILLDYAMPGMDGPAVLEKIRENPEWSKIPVLFRTGMDEETLAEGADGIIPKSKGKPFLLSEVEKAL